MSVRRELATELSVDFHFADLERQLGREVGYGPVVFNTVNDGRVRCVELDLRVYRPGDARPFAAEEAPLHASSRVASSARPCVILAVPQPHPRHLDLELYAIADTVIHVEERSFESLLDLAPLQLRRKVDFPIAWSWRIRVVGDQRRATLSVRNGRRKSNNREHGDTGSQPHRILNNCKG